jgi:hypothetical protein
MSAVDHDARDAINCLIVLFAEGTVVLVQEFAGELVDLFPVEVWWILCLLEEESGGVLQLLGHQFKNGLLYQAIDEHHNTKSAAFSSRLE